MSTVRRLVKGCRHGRLVSLKRSYTPGFRPRHAKTEPAAREHADSTQMELAA